MKVRELVEQLEDLDAEAEIQAVEQPHYPLIADLDRIEVRKNGKLVYLHLHSADEYYSDEDEEEAG